MAESILTADENDFLWKILKVHQESVWFVEKVDLSKDMKDWVKLRVEDRMKIEVMLAFFGFADKIIVNNLMDNFIKEVKCHEAQHFYAYQIMAENVHQEMYGLLMEHFIAPERIEELRHAIVKMPCLKAKADWCAKYTDPGMPFGIRCAAFAGAECIFFSSNFAIIYDVRKRGILDGLCTSNDYIAKDEALHMLAACAVFGYLQKKPSQEDIHALVRDAVEVEQTYVRQILSEPLLGLTAVDMCEFVQVCGDRMCVMLGYAKIWNARSDLNYMDLQALEKRVNFFERHEDGYQLPKARSMGGLRLLKKGEV